MTTLEATMRSLETGSGAMPKPITPAAGNVSTAASPARARVEQVFLWGLEPGGKNPHAANPRRRRGKSTTQTKPIIFF
jgi:hypothetical protein